MYISYEEYVLNGGTLKQSDFLFFEKLAEKKLNYWTFNRIREITKDVKFAMALIIDNLSHIQGDKVSSFSNDGISVSFERIDEIHELYKLISEILPDELTYLGI